MKLKQINVCFIYPESFSSISVFGVVAESESFTDSGIGPCRVVSSKPVVVGIGVSPVVVSGVSHSGVIAVMIQGQRSNSQEEDETQSVVDDLEERLVSSRSAPQVGNEQRQRHQQHTAHRDQSDIVAIVERSRCDVTAEIQRVGADQDQADNSDNLSLKKNNKISNEFNQN